MSELPHRQGPALANPGPLGLLGFGMTTTLLNLHNAGLLPLSIVIVSMGFALGGLAQVIAGVQELKNGNIDAICVEAPVADCYVAALSEELAIAPYEVLDEDGGVAITMAKGSDDLMAVVNEVIQEMIASGEMQEIYDANIELAKEQIVND